MAKSKSGSRRRPIRRIPTLQRIDVKRHEFNRVVEHVNQLTELLEVLQRSQEVQFKRIAQLQAEVDQLRKQP